MRRFQSLIAALMLALGLAGVALAAGTRASVAQVTVTFTDSTLHVSPTTPSSGTTTFVVLNKGKKTHLLLVKGPGVKGARTAKLAAGASAKLTVTLLPGDYILSDPIGLGAYNVMFLDVIKATTVSAKGSSSVDTSGGQPPPMCGSYLTTP